jgi:hypothetical protein
MRALLISVGVAAAALFAAPQLASAQQYPYSYRYCAGAAGNLTSNCGYNTWDQCMASVQGLSTMFCSENPWYRGAPTPPSRRQIRGRAQ